MTGLAFLVACKDTPAPAAPSATLSAVVVGGIPATFEVGVSATLVASATYADGSTRDCTSTALWSSSNTAVATVSSAGVLAGVAPGVSEIRASCGNLSGAGRVNVTPRRTVLSVVLSGVPTDIFIPGDTARLTATATYSDGVRTDCATSATWSSSNPGVAAISPAGVLTGIVPGQTDVRAICGGTTGTLGVTVSAQPPPPEARLSVRLTDGQWFALWRITPIVFDATGSTGVGLTYRIEFGDGDETTAATATHAAGLGPSCTMPFDHDYDVCNASLTVTDRWGRVDTTATNYFLTSFDWDSFHCGYWLAYDGVPESPRSLWMHQDPVDPTRLSGAMRPGYPNPDRPMVGTVGADRSLNLTTTDGSISLVGSFNFDSPPGTWPMRGFISLRRLGTPESGNTVRYYYNTCY